MADQTAKTAEQQTYIVQYRNQDGEHLTGFTVRGEQELREAFTEIQHRPDITPVWRPWRHLNEVRAQGGTDEPWRGRSELPQAAL